MPADFAAGREQDWPRADPGAIRRGLAGQSIEAGAELVRLVGLDACGAIGGVVKRLSPWTVGAACLGRSAATNPAPLLTTRHRSRLGLRYGPADGSAGAGRRR